MDIRPIPSPSHEQSAFLVEQFFTALQQHDIEGVSALLTDDVSLVQPFTFSGLSASEAMIRFPNKKAVLGYIQGVFQNFSQVSFLEREVSVTGAGDSVFVETLGDLRTTIGNQVYSNRYVFKFVLEQDRITFMKEYVNPVTASPILGIPLGVSE